MTNLIASLAFVLITNWTGHVAPDGKEVGYLVTNHVATIEYQGTTNQLTLLSKPSPVAVFREPYVSIGVTVSNIILNDPNQRGWWYYNAPGLVLTNWGYNGITPLYQSNVTNCIGL